MSTDSVKSLKDLVERLELCPEDFDSFAKELESRIQAAGTVPPELMLRIDALRTPDDDELWDDVPV